MMLVSEITTSARFQESLLLNFPSIFALLEMHSKPRSRQLSPQLLQ